MKKFIQHENVREIGSESIYLHALDELALASLLKQQGWTDIQILLAFMHLISKACYPAKECKTAKWIQLNSAVAALLGLDPK